jgi:hypothetical protein
MSRYDDFDIRLRRNGGQFVAAVPHPGSASPASDVPK